MQKKVWKLRFKILILLLAILVSTNCSKSEVSPIDASNNAKSHNNQGTTYLREGDYFAAIKEFNIAIGINPNTQATSVYYNNLGRTYMEIYKINRQKKFAQMAQTCFERAVLQDCMNITYYKNLVESYEAQGILNTKTAFLLANVNKNPYNQVIVGLIYLKQNKIRAAVTMLDDFCAQNPDLVIVADIKRIINSYNII